jgi:phenylalanine-4-hydroxylase
VPTITGDTKYPITEYQPTYFFTESFKAAGQTMLDFATTLGRPFEVHYDPYTLSIEILDTKEKIAALLRDTSTELNNLAKALGTLQ